MLPLIAVVYLTNSLYSTVRLGERTVAEVSCVPSNLLCIPANFTPPHVLQVPICLWRLRFTEGLTTGETLRGLRINRPKVSPNRGDPVERDPVPAIDLGVRQLAAEDFRAPNC